MDYRNFATFKIYGQANRIEDNTATSYAVSLFLCFTRVAAYSGLYTIGVYWRKPKLGHFPGQFQIHLCCQQSQFIGI
jgi:hypothetical protein